jgi:hypothetical protein
MACQLWPVRWPDDIDVGSLPDAAVTAAVEGAGNVLWALTGRVYGSCEVTEVYRPRPGIGCVGPYRRDVAWLSAAASHCCTIRLARTPVSAVSAVTLFGAVATDWFRSGDSIIRQGACWPSVAADEPAPVAVTYTFGAGFPAGCASAVGEVAAELLAPQLRNRECRLPGRMTTVVRNNVTVTMQTAAELDASGLLGLPLADALVRTLNPNRLRQPSRVFGVDGARRA